MSWLPYEGPSPRKCRTSIGSSPARRSSPRSGSPLAGAARPPAASRAASSVAASATARSVSFARRGTPVIFPARVRPRAPHPPAHRRRRPTPVLESGPPEAEEAVVFVHGNPGSMEDFRELVLRVAPFARAACRSRCRGSAGRRSPATSTSRIGGYARHLGAQLDALGGPRAAHLVLHDLGRAVGLEWALRRPDAFASATLIGHRRPASTTAGTCSRGSGRRAVSARRSWRRRRAPRSARSCGAGSSSRCRGRSSTGCTGRFDPATRRTVLRTYRAMSGVASGARARRRACGALDRPALVLWGGRDPYLPIELAERQLEAFPSARTVVFDDSAHWPFADAPDAFLAEVVPWCGNRPAPDAPTATPGAQACEDSPCGRPSRRRRPAARRRLRR
jgi:pimeloyl-ACP methyl ester carboxylesterase